MPDNHSHTLTLTFEVQLTPEQFAQLEKIEDEAERDDRHIRETLHPTEWRKSCDAVWQRVEPQQKLIFYPIFRALKFSNLIDWEW